MLKLKSILPIFGSLVMIFLCYGISLSQTPKTVELTNTDSVIKVENLHLALVKLGEYYKSPIGFEFAIDGDEPQQIAANLIGKSFEVSLDKLVSQDSRYTWITKDGVINVYPKKNRDDLLKNFLDTKIQTFNISERSSVYKIKQSIVKTPEIEELFKASNITPFQSGFLSSDFRIIYKPASARKTEYYSLQSSNSTIREILNRLVKESSHKYWVINRNTLENDFWVSF